MQVAWLLRLLGVRVLLQRQAVVPCPSVKGVWACNPSGSHGVYTRRTCWGTLVLMLSCRPILAGNI